MAQENVGKNFRRIEYVDIAKGITIIGVVLLHMFGALSEVDEYPFHKPAIAFLSGYVMVCFFILSGMTIYLSGECKRSLKQIFLRKFKTILIPYVSFSLIVIIRELIRICIGISSNERADVIKMIVDTLTLRGHSVLWFLPALFFGELLFVLIQKKKENIRVGVYLTTILYVLMGFLAVILVRPLHTVMASTICVNYILTSFLFVLLRVLLATFFLFVGYEWMHFTEQRDNSKNKAVVDLLISIVLLFVSIYCVLTPLGGEIDFNSMTFSHIPGFYLQSLCSSFGVIYLAKAINRWKLMSWIGQNSLAIMVTHLGFNILGNALTISYKINMYVPRAKVYVLYATAILLICIFEYIAILFLNRFAPILLGKSWKRG